MEIGLIVQKHKPALLKDP